MPSAVAERRALLHRVVHATLAQEARHRSITTGDETEITVRLHSSRQPRLLGDVQGRDYAEVLTMVDNMVFYRPQIEEKGIVLNSGDTIIMTEMQGEEFTLNVEEPKTGPSEIVWSVSRPGNG